MKKLIPLNVPWMISPSMSNIKLISEENGHTLIQFFGLFGFEPTSESEVSKLNIGIGTQGLRLDPTIKSGRHQLISLIFKNLGWLRRNPQHSDREVVNESLFDWSEVQGAIRPGEEISNWQKRCLLQWNETKIAPNPSVYIVANSDWKTVETKNWGLNHYLILGESSSIEILAQDFEWISEGTILGW